MWLPVVLGKALEGRSPHAIPGDGRTNWETRLRMLSLKAKNWKLKQTNKKSSTKKNNFAAALVGWVFLVKSFLVKTAWPLFLPWGFPGMMGNCIWLWGNTFVFLYPLLFMNMVEPPFFQMQQMPVIWFYLVENLRVVVGKLCFAYHLKCHMANCSTWAQSQLDSSGKRKRGNSVSLHRIVSELLSNPAWSVLHGWGWRLAVPESVASWPVV